VAKKRRQHDEEAWRNARKVCRLNARQVEMARALGMNPKKLPGLRPSPQQRWKLPVGEFIEERYWKRFGGNSLDNETREPTPGSRKPSTAREDAHAPGAIYDPMWQAQDLICYLTNLADDLQQRLAQGTVVPEVLPQVGGELREIADALDTGAPIPQVPGIPAPPRETRAASPRRDRPARTFDDDIPF
jgi:hypothetical protein